MWRRGGPRIEVDRPLPGAAVAGTIEVSGWAFSRGAAIERIEAALGSAPPVPLAHGRPRADVAAVHGCGVACGFAGRVPLDGLPPGPMTLSVVAIDGKGRRAARDVNIVRGPVAAAASRDAGIAIAPSPPAPVRPPALADRPAAARPADEIAAAGELGRLLARLRDERDRDPTLLDATGLGFAAVLPGELVVTPLDATRLPYADHSFDVVAVDRDEPDRVALARRLAVCAVVRMAREGALQILWQGAVRARRWPTVSIVIPVYNQSTLTDACLRAVLETWPETVEGEVLVVDDGSTDGTAELVAEWSARDRRVRRLAQPENRGFIAAANAGAAAATGEVLVFLNNDTVPRPGWLTPLLGALARGRVGAVGGKLLYPDGVLQEAGGVVFSDGDACNFGKGDPESGHPLFDHVREVDYCSGALLATPRALFTSLGGFDPSYAPAYYEDADYAFRLREGGYRVLYQPAAIVVHVEGGTAGRDAAKGPKAQQVHNRETFAARWRGALARQPSRPAAFDRDAFHRLHAREGRRALVMLPTMPELDREGGSRRAFHLIDLLLESGWAVSVIVENATGGQRYARAVRQLGAATYAGPLTRDAGPERLADRASLLARESFDLALIAFWHVAELYLPDLRARSPKTRVLVDSVDLHFLRQARSAFGRARREARPDPLDGRFADELRRELNVYGTADGVLAVSAKEAGWVDDLVGAAGHAHCVPLLEDGPALTRPLEERRGLVFVGNFRHPPNVDALGFLAEVVARLPPALLAAHPLSIVGNALETRLLGPLAHHPHVHAVGWVPSLEPYLEGARIALVPLRQGAGTKAKLLHALRAGTPCVSTTVGIEGYGLAAGREVWVADGPDAFAAGIARLAEDDETWRALSRQGRRAVEEVHGRSAVGARLQEAIAAVLAGRS